MTASSLWPASSLRRKFGLAAAIVVLVIAGITGMALSIVPVPPWALDPTDPRVTLADVEREVGRYYGKPQITASDLRRKLPAEPVALFDVRTAEEFAAGHLPGAVRIDPDMTAEEFFAEHADKLAGRAAVFYCAVGVRSSVMMQRLAAARPLPKSAYNLSGGVFRWSADGGSLVAAAGEGVVHPYDAAWGELLRRETRRR